MKSIGRNFISGIILLTGISLNGNVPGVEKRIVGKWQGIYFPERSYLFYENVDYRFIDRENSTNSHSGTYLISKHRKQPVRLTLITDTDRIYYFPVSGDHRPRRPVRLCKNPIE